MFNFFVSTLIIWLTAIIIATVITEPICFKYGWRTAVVTWNFEQHCIKRENGTDFVKRLSEITED